MSHWVQPMSGPIGSIVFYRPHYGLRGYKGGLMARSSPSSEDDARLAAERAKVVCRYCGGKPIHFPPSSRPQTDAVCEDCSKRAPWMSVVDSVVELAHPEPKAVDIRFDGVKRRPSTDLSKENFT